MKVSPKGESRFLAKEDLQSPLTLTIDRVTIETLKGSRGEEQKYVLHFQERVKPMVFNVVNRKRVIGVYGDESDNWTGKKIEVYVDANVEMGGEVVGGIRLRVPAQQPVKPAPTKPAQPPANSNQPKRPLTIDEKHRLVVNGFAQAKTDAKIKEWAKWASAFQFAPHHEEEQSDAYHQALERLGISETVGAGNDIPF